MISENNVSILIPVYRQKKFARRAVLSAMQTRAGEIIISEDHGNDGTFEMLRQLTENDQRVKLIQPSKNVGLWMNHLFLLQNCRKDWVKFLQQDDYFKDGALAELCNYAKPNVAVISMLPVYEDLHTNKIVHKYILDKPLIFSGHDYIRSLRIARRELGRPSYTLFQKSALVISEEAWGNDMSCDYVANMIAPTTGDVVVLPPGKIICGLHKQQDSATQSFEVITNKIYNSIKYLKQYEALKKVIPVISFSEFAYLSLTMLKPLFKQRTNWKAFKPLFKLLRYVQFKYIIHTLHHSIKLSKYKFQFRKGVFQIKDNV